MEEKTIEEYKLLSTMHVSRLLDCSVETVRNYYKQGLLAGEVLPTGQIIFLTKDVLKLKDKLNK